MAEHDQGDDFSLDDIKIHSAEVVDKPVEGLPYAPPVEIIVEAPAWALMNRHAREDLRHEAGGIMLGQIYRHEEVTAVRITTAVAAREAVNSMASIQFTYDAWSQMEKERQERAASEKLVGWYHTHPGFTAFFSGTDRFMHQHFFTQPWHVALVIDPVNGEHRFYRWDDGQIQESTEFLLQVTHWPGPQPPLAAVLSGSLREAVKQAEESGEPDEVELGAALGKLIGCLRRGPEGTPLEDLLPFVVGCSELPEEALTTARRRVQQEEAPDSPIHPSDLGFSSSNQNPEGAIAIAYGWLAQANDRRHLHLHGVEESQKFCGEVALPMALADLTLEEGASVLVLSREAERPLFRLEPPLPLLRSATRETEDEHPQRLVEVEIDWGEHRPEGKIGKILAARHTLYLLTRDRLLVLTGAGERARRMTCVAAHPASACGWESFTDLTGWTADQTGNLFLLRGATKEVWQLERLAERWSRFVVAEDVEKPTSLAAGMTTLSILDAGAKSIFQYAIADGRLLCRRRLEEALRREPIWHLFSDGYQRLYLVTDRYVFHTR